MRTAGGPPGPAAPGDETAADVAAASSAICGGQVGWPVARWAGAGPAGPRAIRCPGAIGAASPGTAPILVAAARAGLPGPTSAPAFPVCAPPIPAGVSAAPVGTAPGRPLLFGAARSGPTGPS